MKIPARILLTSIWGILCAMILAAPLLMGHAFPAAASALYFPFSFFCHQHPDRSYMLGLYPLAVCHRCFGMYLGFFFGTVCCVRRMESSVKLRRAAVLIAVLPMMLDVSLNYAGLWPGAPGLRCATGLIFGFMISPLLVQGLAEMLQGGVPGGCAINTIPIKGDLS